MAAMTKAKKKNDFHLWYWFFLILLSDEKSAALKAVYDKKIAYQSQIQREEVNLRLNADFVAHFNET